jgi:hypothetical protein
VPNTERTFRAAAAWARAVSVNTNKQVLFCLESGYSLLFRDVIRALFFSCDVLPLRLGMVFKRQGKRERKRCPNARIAFNPDFSIMLLHDSFHDCEAYP